MSSATVGLLSGLLVTASVVPYGWQVYRGKIKPNLTSWSLWALIGLALLLSYRSSGANDNVWPAVFGFTNPLIITILVLWRRGQWVKPSGLEKLCIAISLASLATWYLVRDQQGLAQYALYLGMVADVGAAVPTIAFVWKRPWDDRPFAWICYSIGYGLGMLAITEHTVANYALPMYMTLGSASVAIPLVLYRWRERTPLSRWI